MRFTLFIGAVIVVLVTYIITWATLPPDIFWSADEGAKYIQLRTMQAGYEVPYLGQRLDPDFRFYPQHPVFPRPLPDGTFHLHWAIWFPVLSLPFFEWFGLPGLYVVPLVSGVLVAALSGWLAQRILPAAAPWTVLAVGLASPIFLYSMLFWEHTLAVLLALAGLWQAMHKRWWLVVILLVAAMLLRIELLFFGLAVLGAVGITWLPRAQLSRRQWLLLGLAGVIGVVLVASVAQLLASRGLIVPRYQQFIDLARATASNPDFWGSLPRRLFETWVNTTARVGLILPQEYGWLAIGGSVLMMVALLVPPRVRIVFIWGAGVLLGIAAGYGLILAERYRTLHGFVLVAPQVVFMALLLNYERRNQRFETTLFMFTTELYLLLGVVAVIVRHADITANIEWGTRYLLTLYPLLSIYGVVGVVHFLRSDAAGWQKRLTVALAILLFLMGCGYQLRGLQEIRDTKAELQPQLRALALAPEPVVTDLIWIPSVLSTYFVAHEVYMVPNRAALYDWLSHTEPQVDTFVFVTFFALTPEFLNNAPVTLTPLGQEQVDGITYTQLAVGPGP